MRLRALISCVAIAILLLQIAGPIVNASIVFGPVVTERTSGKPDSYTYSFSLDDLSGNYSLYVRNGDGSKMMSSAVVSLNGENVFGPNDFKKKNPLLEADISLLANNSLMAELRSSPGSLLTMWIEDDRPDILIMSPWDDTDSNGTVTFAGIVTDKNVSVATINHNGRFFTIPVENGNFSSLLELDTVNNVSISIVDSAKVTRSACLLLDGDYLPMSSELAMGFDPLSPDSDSSLTIVNEAGNGVMDGREMFGSLPAYVRSRIGSDPLMEDTDDDGLSDYFELMKLGLLTGVRMNDTDMDGVSDALEDIDGDGLNNLVEQELGSDPLFKDSDDDGLDDLAENDLGTNLLRNDSDGDGLLDISEIRFGTDPWDVDSDNDSIMDGFEVYTSDVMDEELGVIVAVTGVGDCSRGIRLARETAAYYNNNSALISPLVDIRYEGDFESANITFTYDPSVINDPRNVSICYLNETLGVYLPLDTIVDLVNHTFTAGTTYFSLYGAFYTPM